LDYQINYVRNLIMWCCKRFWYFSN